MLEVPDLEALLASAAAPLARRGVAVPPLGGKLLRPAVAWALVPPASRDSLDLAFWSGALAIQMVHEASLLHDDILDDAATRRGEATLVARRGVGPALVLGDRYLTGAYRAAAAAGSEPFLAAFIEAVERTVAGEVAQEGSCGRVLAEAEYQDIIRGKSGELFGAAALLAATRCGASLDAARDVGCAVGALYQMVDDFLDYCPLAGTGKEPFQDYGQGKFTFVLQEAGIRDFGLPAREVHDLLFTAGASGAPSPMEAALARLERLQARIVREAREVFGHGEELRAVLAGWVAAARQGLVGEVADLAPLPSLSLAAASSPSRASAEAAVVSAARSLGEAEAWGAYFGRHSKSFRFASRLFPAGPRADVEGVYAFCRFTDDLVDEGDVPLAEARARLSVWGEMAEAAYRGEAVEIPLLDTVMGRMQQADVPFHYARDLLAGVGMDLDPTDYATLPELEVYTYRVASVVGGWVTELFGLRDPALLSRAFSLGHAMQLTNILRDVGEDWRRDRLYLPVRLMDRFGVGRDAVARVAAGEGVSGEWVELMEHLMSIADRHYQAAFEAIPLLPAFYRRPVAVAARVYHGIHDEIRRNGYDNGTRRAHTSLRRKVWLGTGGLWELRKLPRRSALGPGLALAHQDT
ncbi:MAG TPA: squalene/phytoene synthase family protein [Longimicrobiales bacterium]|nr:squalene/phytoene synthase family protein [Longimicrobiales bacterium]